MPADKKTFLGIGEAMVELSRSKPGQLQQGFAGDVLNTLWYVRACLGSDWNVRFFTALGSDPLSDEMIEFAESGGILCDQIIRSSSDLPGIYMINLKDGERSFDYWRDQSAARRMCADIAPIRKAIAAADLIYLSGITLAILPPIEAENLISELSQPRTRGQVAFDPNIRPRLWDDTDRMRDLITRAAGLSDIVLPSYDDEASAFGDTSAQATAARYANAGCRHVVVKNGPDPVIVLKDGVEHQFPVSEWRKPVDTTAAGDSFNAAYLARWLETEDVAQAVKAGQYCAGEVVGKKGAIVDFRPPAG